MKPTLSLNPDLLSLNFKDWDVSNFRFGVDARGYPVWCLIRWQYTAEQAIRVFGNMAGPEVIDAANDPKRAQNKFWFLWRIRPRQNRNLRYRDVLNYRYENICVNEKEKCVVEEGGYREFPALPRDSPACTP